MEVGQNSIPRGEPFIRCDEEVESNLPHCVDSRLLQIVCILSQHLMGDSPIKRALVPRRPFSATSVVQEARAVWSNPYD
jgi:hypothetical protein